MKSITIRGSAFEIGQQLGEYDRDAWHQKMVQTALWQTVTAMKDSEQTRRMRAPVEAQFPQIWDELKGMASGPPRRGLCMELSW